MRKFSRSTFSGASFLLRTIALLCLFGGVARAQYWCTPSELPALPVPARALRVVAFGTSVMWGDGLPTPETFRGKVAAWLQAETGRPVSLWTWAHSAAVLDGIETSDNWQPVPGDINYGGPTVQEQIRCATHYQDVSAPDLILLEGCINDVGAESIVFPWTNSSRLTVKTQTACGEHMKTTLEMLHRSFKDAVTVVVGYYPLVSDKSSLRGFFGSRQLLRVLSLVDKSMAAKSDEDMLLPASQEADAEEPLTGAEKKNRMVTNSQIFYRGSRSALLANVDLMAQAAPGQFFFAGIPQDPVTQMPNPHWAYGADDTHEWKISFHFWRWVFNPDDKYEVRLCECKNHWRPGPSRFVCETSPAFHPNVKGADIYTAAIESVIPAALIARWRTPPVAVP